MFVCHCGIEGCRDSVSDIGFSRLFSSFFSRLLIMADLQLLFKDGAVDLQQVLHLTPSDFEAIVRTKNEDSSRIYKALMHGFVDFIQTQLNSFVCLSSERPGKVLEDLSSCDVTCPLLYAYILASGSNWWVTPEYSGAFGDVIKTAEQDMMIRKAHYLYAKDGLRKGDNSQLEKDVSSYTQMVLNAEALYDQAVLEGRKLPPYVSRWQGYIKFIGRSLPWDDEWAEEWLKIQEDGFQKDMQLRKLQSGDVWYSLLSAAIAIGVKYHDWKVAETTDDRLYAIGIKFVSAVTHVKSGADKDALMAGGRNILGQAHVAAALQ